MKVSHYVTLPALTPTSSTYSDRDPAFVVYYYYYSFNDASEEVNKEASGSNPSFSLTCP